mmetsp:Transcript_6870/g.18616  ORF Transcript_6870/g.18616 Transcript_6870/m.18616 type:complete len:146 (+) Transcript_6870:46-483(+)
MTGAVEQAPPAHIGLDEACALLEEEITPPEEVSLGSAENDTHEARATMRPSPKRARPVLWTSAAKRNRAVGDTTPAAAQDHREPTVDEQSKSIPGHYLQAHLFIKRRHYMESQDPRILWQAKALEAELRRRMVIALEASLHPPTQ